MKLGFRELRNRCRELYTGAVFWLTPRNFVEIKYGGNERNVECKHISPEVFDSEENLMHLRNSRLSLLDVDSNRNLPKGHLLTDCGEWVSAPASMEHYSFLLLCRTEPPRNRIKKGFSPILPAAKFSSERKSSYFRILREQIFLWKLLYQAIIGWNFKKQIPTENFITRKIETGYVCFLRGQIPVRTLRSYN